jgi:[citrate (pro-3S)-lyase] ligase
VTNAYNQKMKEYLPPRGIEVFELERKETLDAPISASRVRALLEQKDADTLRQLVPPTTFAYLEEHFLK